MPQSLPEPWLRGPMPGISPLLQPAAHAFALVLEDVERAVGGLTDEQLWQEPGGAPSVGFHLAHLAESTDRLMTYARGEALSDKQLASLAAEKGLGRTRASADILLERLRTVIDAAYAQLAGVDEQTLTHRRTVGRRMLQSTHIGLLFHAAEHAARHCGQIVTTAKVVRGIEG